MAGAAVTVMLLRPAGLSGFNNGVCHITRFELKMHNILRGRISDFDNKIEYMKSTITSIQDYPVPGILFRDITTLCEDARAFGLTIDMLYEAFKDVKIDKVLSSEARGFVFGAPLAARLGAGFVMVRKPGKLPRETMKEEYQLEYGTNELHMHVDSVKEGERVLCVDDLLATGGTIIATIKLAQRAGAEVVGAAFVIDLVDLGGCDKIKAECGVDSFGLLDFPGH